MVSAGSCWSLRNCSSQVLTIYRRMSRHWGCCLNFIFQGLFEWIIVLILGFKSYKFHFILLFEIFYEIFWWNLFYWKRKIYIFINCFSKPLFTCSIFKSGPKPLHLFSWPLRNKSLFLNFLPKSIFIKVISIIWIHYL